MSAFERLRHVTRMGRAVRGIPDRSAIVGRAAPTKPVYEAHSFSGRGVMQSYGAGQALADLIANGKYGAFDASTLSRERFDRGAASLGRAAHLKSGALPSVKLGFLALTRRDI